MINNIIKVLIFLIVFATIALVIYISLAKQYILKNPEKYECDPFFQLVGPIIGMKQSDFKCNYAAQKTTFGNLMSPMKKLLNSQAMSSNSSFSIMDQLQGRLSDMGFSNILNFGLINDIFSNITVTFDYLFHKFKDIFKRIFATLQIIGYMAETLYKTCESLIMGPIGFAIEFMSNPVGALCFDKNTLIEMNNGSIKKICNIKVNDILKDNIKVTGIIKSSTDDNIMYKYNNIIVSKYHYCQYKGNWDYVSNIELFEKIQNYNEDYIYCLFTESNIIKVYDSITNKYIIFSDFIDINNFEFNILIKVLQKMYLNNDCLHSMKRIFKNIPREISHTSLGKVFKKYYTLNPVTKKDFNTFQSGFTKDTKFLLANGKKRKISKLRIGDVLSNKSIVKSIIKLKNEHNIYENIKNKNIKLSGNTLIKDDKKWNYVINSKSFVKVNESKYKHLYNIISSKYTINIDNISFINDLTDIPVNKIFPGFNNFIEELYLLEKKKNV